MGIRRAEADVDVLVAHPSQDLRARVGRVLGDLGEDVADVDRADQALRLCTAERPSVALVAASFAQGDDGALLRDIKCDPDLFNTALVVIDDHVSLEDALDGLGRGVHGYLIEPFSDTELVAAVRSAARTKTLQDQLMDRSHQLERLAFTDPLTGVDNRRSTFRRLGAAISGARRHGRPLAVVMLDIDHFKSVNDEHGHDTGDAVLVTVANRLAERVRHEDAVGRLGGEEFLVLLPDSGEGAAATVAESLRRAVADEPVHAGRRSVPVTVSAGWALWQGEDAETLVRRADAALYAAKAAGRNAVQAG
jgi:two-component system cell cycle response regulator